MMRLTWLGHSTVLLETGGARILTDPILRAGIGPVRRQPSPVDEAHLEAVDTVLISHLHHDHLDLPSLRRLPRATQVVVPIGGGRLLRSTGLPNVVEVDAGDMTRIGGVAVRAVAARHDGRRLPFGPSAPALGFVVEADERVYFAGDTDLFPGMARLAPGLDVAILPVGGWGPTLRGGHLDPGRAAEALRLLRPRVAVAVHWGTLWPIGLGRVRRHRLVEPAIRFADAAALIAPEVRVALLEPGGWFDVPPTGSSA